MIVFTHLDIQHVRANHVRDSVTTLDKDLLSLRLNKHDTIEIQCSERELEVLIAMLVVQDKANKDIQQKRKQSQVEDER